MNWPRLWNRFCNWWRLLGRRRHHYRIGQARRVLARLAAIRNAGAVEGQILAYLRKVDPTTFEEMILELAEKDGCLVQRNARYSGDGGIDGRFHVPGESRKWIIQAKRYSSVIRPQHVVEFAELVRRAGVAGLFVHTGRTGGFSRVAAGTADVVILSGFQLARVAAGEVRFREAVMKSHDPRGFNQARVGAGHIRRD